MTSAQRTTNLYEQNPPRHRRSSRMMGTNPRAKGTNPRAKRQLEEEHKKLEKELLRLYKRRFIKDYKSEADREESELSIKKIEKQLEDIKENHGDKWVRDDSEMNSIVTKCKDDNNEADKTMEAWSARESNASVRQAQQEPSIVLSHESNQLKEKEAVVKPRSTRYPIVQIVKPSSEVVDELADACRDLYRIDNGQRKSCACKIYDALRVGVNRHVIEDQIRDCLEYDKQGTPHKMFQWRMNELIGKYQRGLDGKSLSSPTR